MTALMIAIGLLLIFEGMGPALFPKQWRDMVSQMAQQPDQQLKRIGTGLILVGAVIVLLVVS
ncbi:DUF2065 domain-containing protein [Vibrio sp. CK2-1]|uniref:DUF2065 domain-containing protein n=1 Tax=Vibrio sp. CK2-1 TaxID=2912249 RepID=UPI001F3D4402|nr:DUF2065 domain-containing protein [Vibrio sp. CK2-1]MCF7355678.1 DUF2065 domain-containing protein [Vibrio sp. CK2-1]